MVLCVTLGRWMLECIAHFLSEDLAWPMEGPCKPHDCAEIGTLQLEQSIKEELDIPVTNSTFWSDSTCMLQYIKNKSRRLHTFVENRLSIIHERSTPYQWRHVPSELNPADEVSRGLTVKDMINNSKWLNGPMLLRKKEESWPSNLTNVQNELSVDDPELKLDVQSHSQMTIFF